MRILLLVLLTVSLLRAAQDSVWVRYDDDVDSTARQAFSEVIVNAAPDSVIGINWTTGDTVRLRGVFGKLGKGRALFRKVKMVDVSSLDSVSLQPVEAEYRVTVAIADAPGLQGADFRLAYDKELMLPRSVVMGDAFSGWIHAANLTGADTVRVSIASGTPADVIDSTAVFTVVFRKLLDRVYSEPTVTVFANEGRVVPSIAVTVAAAMVSLKGGKMKVTAAGLRKK